MVASEEIPLFPLGTVLFPGGRLPLRIFEPRYLSMVSECMRAQLPFGVVLIREGNEAGQPATFHSIGTTCRIVDFDQLDDGMLGITGVGQQRFKVVTHRLEPDNLVMGAIEYITDQGRAEDEENAYLLVAEFLRNTLDREDLAAYREQLDEDWDDRNWVSFQTAELFPMSAQSRQLLLEMNVADRLQELQYILQDNQLVSTGDGNPAS